MPSANAGQAQNQWMPIIAIGMLFFIFGFVTWLNGPLIAFVQVAFNLSDVSEIGRAHV